jgi:protein subunit release factor B
MVKVYPITLSKQEAILQRMQMLGIVEQDLEENFIRGSGKGGQKKNKTSNCVQLTHIPTGIMIRFEKYRERPLNQILARRLLCEKIECLNRGKQSPSETRHLRIRQQKKRRERKRKKIE